MSIPSPDLSEKASIRSFQTPEHFNDLSHQISNASPLKTLTRDSNFNLTAEKVAPDSDSSNLLSLEDGNNLNNITLKSLTNLNEKSLVTPRREEYTAEESLDQMQFDIELNQVNPEQNMTQEEICELRNFQTNIYIEQDIKEFEAL